MVDSAMRKGTANNRQTAEKPCGHIGHSLADKLLIRIPRCALLGGIGTGEGDSFGKTDQRNDPAADEKRRKSHPRAHAVGNCDTTIRSAAAEAQPISMGCDISEVIDPNLKSPMPRRPAPTISANSAAKPM